MPAKKPLDYLKLAQQLNKIQLQLYGFTVEDMLQINQEVLTDEEIQNMAADISLFYNKLLKGELDKMIIQEMKGIVENGSDHAQVQFMRGSIAGLIKLKQWCESQVPTPKVAQQGNQPNPGVNL